MGMELFTEAMPEEENCYFDENNDDYSSLDGERCGICMDVVIDRGVLDCCQHWFCFTCIDNWATITNLCPLCQSEFQLITCVPVFDTIGGSQTDEDLYTRDDDWSIEGKTNTLSFPSYYIDENAVVCLDGDGCKVRAGSVTNDGDLNLDTSIACDSCDIWYHAFCVGFDTEDTSESSWLCPRCVDKIPESSVSNKKFGPENASNNCLIEASFSGEVSVSVADAGETAVVVSIVERNKQGEVPDRNLSNLDPKEAINTGILIPDSVPDTPNIELSLSQNECPDTVQLSATPVDVKPDASTQLFSDELIQPNLDLHLGLSVNSFSACNDTTDTKVAGDQVLQTARQKNVLGCPRPGEKVMPDKNEDKVVASGAKRKRRENRNADDGGIRAKAESAYYPKRAKVEGSGELINTKDQPPGSVSDNSDKSLVTILKDDKLKCNPENKNLGTDIMDIVQGTGRKTLKKLVHSNQDEMSSKQRENAARLRVKKIMRRTGDEDSSVLVEKLRKEIREAVRNKSSGDKGENQLDPKLLTAFRAVVTGSTTETKKSSVDLKAKRSLLQKGKVRENLTKKIYGIGGRRRRAWTRDCEIEFWKHRCSKMSKPEKIQTLKSVLDLLRDDSKTAETKHVNEGEGKSSILSRLYLADSSVFPRKEDIKPVSSLTIVAADQNKQNGLTSNTSTSFPSPFNIVPPVNVASVMVASPLEIKGAKISVLTTKADATRNVLSIKGAERPFASASSGSKLCIKEEAAVKCDNTKSDKRKWALEVLARKTAATSKSGALENEEDSAVLKHNHPLLAQLPKDMRPALAASRHNKIPMSVRMAQLHRLTEHFLRKANLSVMRRTAETELAIADAVNIEKEVADRSNSKLVYINLCSQELLRRSDNASNVGVAESNPCQTSEVLTNSSEELSEVHSSDPAVNEALRNAGLLSDSPPNSPNCPLEEDKEEICVSKEVEDHGPENVFEVDAPPELDIYGDFEYNLEDDDFSGAGTSMISVLQQGESKMKVVFSTINPVGDDGSMELQNHEKQDILEGPVDSSSLIGCEPSGRVGSSTAAGKTENCLIHSSLIDEELSGVDCEELYGPDKEPLIEKYPEMASLKLNELAMNDEVQQSNGVDESKQASKSAEQGNDSSSTASKCPNSPSQLARNENLQVNKISKSRAEKESGSSNSVSTKVEAYVKEHIRPLCKSGVISVEQYRWAVGKTTEKVMKYHPKDKKANFLIKEGEKIKKLAEQYIEAAQHATKD
ncbi:PREDICTED: uncharacterized protein At4g10930 isoform X2 [Nicotiana attenuata]|uniref:uncharacterized protein At4g10930 isoform X2 n=1 Tax=Nicotiana attenuata TaxID=49451 RepID=UPI000904E3E2|nr:PREDICTED: uncharacterized protein At4g10930 isoform X2 [Nicotiana attenuata]